jgi:hypothetical protein
MRSKNDLEIDFKSASTSEIEDLQLQIKEELETRSLYVPQLNTNIDWSPIIQMVEEQLNNPKEISWANSCFEHSVTEKVIELMYGITGLTWWSKYKAK